MTELKLVLKLLYTLVIQIILLPFRVVSKSFKVLEKACRVVKKTINFLIDSILEEI